MDLVLELTTKVEQLTQLRMEADAARVAWMVKRSSFFHNMFEESVSASKSFIDSIDETNRRREQEIRSWAERLHSEKMASLTDLEVAVWERKQSMRSIKSYFEDGPK
ncbi:MAG: hypothetical protein ABL962_01290 [Fimbriimonadaceae bacterium]